MLKFTLCPFSLQVSGNCTITWGNWFLLRFIDSNSRRFGIAWGLSSPCLWRFCLFANLTFFTRGCLVVPATFPSCVRWICLKEHICHITYGLFFRFGYVCAFCITTPHWNCISSAHPPLGSQGTIYYLLWSLMTFRCIGHGHQKL